MVFLEDKKILNMFLPINFQEWSKKTDMKILKDGMYLSLDWLLLLINTTYSIFFFKSNMINKITEVFLFLKLSSSKIINLSIILSLFRSDQNILFSYNHINNKTKLIFFLSLAVYKDIYIAI